MGCEIHEKGLEKDTTKCTVDEQKFDAYVRRKNDKQNERACGHVCAVLKVKIINSIKFNEIVTSRSLFTKIHILPTDAIPL